MKNINIYINYLLYYSDDDCDSSNRDLSDTSIELD